MALVRLLKYGAATEAFCQKLHRDIWLMAAKVYFCYQILIAWGGGGRDA